MLWNETDMDTRRKVLFLCIFTFSVFQTYDQQIFYDQYRPANPHIYWVRYLNTEAYLLLFILFMKKMKLYF